MASRRKFFGAKPKVRGQPVELPEERTDAELEQIAENVQRAAMEKIIRTLPVAKRRDWPKGQATHTLSGQMLAFNVEITHFGKPKTIRGRIAVPLGTVLTDKARQKAVGEQLADHLIRDLMTFYRYEDTPAEEREYAPRTPPATARAVADAYEEMIAAEQERLKAKKRVGKLGPICLICGAEDRDAYPDWGACPHTAGDEDDS